MSAAVVRPGDRIRLTAMPDDPVPIPAGEEGVVGHVTATPWGRQISVAWDCGRTLSLCVPPDEFDVVGREAVPEPWASIYRKEEA